MKLAALLTPLRVHRHEVVLEARAPSLRLRLRVRLGRARLDRAVAAGASSNATPEFAMRTFQLTRMRQRHVLARSLRRLVADAEDPLRAHVSIIARDHRPVVAAAREALLGVADGLERRGPLSPIAIARVRVLACDGAGPFYASSAGRSLADAVWWIADGMQSCPPHDWRCPVVAKLDPGRVVWTCACCGTTAAGDERGVPPD